MKMAKEALPSVVIELLDCTTAAAGQGLVVLAAARAAALGKDLTEVVTTVRSVMQRVSLFATLDTLHYLVKGGRVPKAAGLASSLFQIKPIFTVNGGDAFPVVNARTTSGAIKRILKLMGQKVVKGQPLHVAVMHADVIDRAVALSREISARFDCTELFITEFTPVMGVHTGPGVIGVAFYSGD
jgi:DegV family protein with EDD domain